MHFAKLLVDLLAILNDYYWRKNSLVISYETLFLLSIASASKHTTQLYLFSNHLKSSAFFASRFTCIYSFFRDSIALVGSASD